jgi:hypothetical protein
VYWDGNQVWYKGKVIRYSEKTKKFKILYDDKEIDQIDLTSDLYFIHENQKRRDSSSAPLPTKGTA